MKKKTKQMFRTEVFFVAIAVAIFGIVAAAGYVYSQNPSNGIGVHSAMHLQPSGMGMTNAQCNQMMQSFNISQSAINSMDQMMAGMHGGSSGGLQT